MTPTPQQARRLARGSQVEIRTTGGLVVGERCRMADTFWLRLKGLLGRRDLPTGEGVWIVPTFSIHMMFMRFAIDAVFLDRDDRVVAIVENLRPWRGATRRGAKSVLEIAAGEATRRGLKVGDVLQAEAIA